jgi:hypothetical protein
LGNGILRRTAGELCRLFPMKLQSPNFDIWGTYQQEMICSPSDIKAYNDSIGGFEGATK